MLQFSLPVAHAHYTDVTSVPHSNTYDGSSLPFPAAKWLIKYKVTEGNRWLIFDELTRRLICRVW